MLFQEAFPEVTPAPREELWQLTPHPNLKPNTAKIHLESGKFNQTKAQTSIICSSFKSNKPNATQT